MKVFALIITILTTVHCQDWEEYRYLGYFKTPFVAFTNVGEYFGRKSIYVTSFFSGNGDEVRVAPDIANQLENLENAPVRTVASVVWPNQAMNVPESVFGSNFIVVSGGFLRPPAQTGQVTIVDLVTEKSYQVSKDEPFYFYHQSEFYDVDGDGLMDIISAKANFPYSGIGKFVWFKNPGTMTFPWQETVLISPGPDVFFRLHDFNNDGIPEVIATVSFNQKLSIWINRGKFSNPLDWVEKVIDNKIGFAFDLQIADLNNDGQMDIIATNHQSRLNESAVFAYEVPSDLINGKYTRHVLAMGFDTTQPGQGQASPGSPVVFHPITFRTDEKPYILVGGDGTQRAHLLRPLSESVRDWAYDMKTIIYVNCTVGGVSVGDVDGDGYSELFIPAFENGQVHVYTYSP